MECKKTSHGRCHNCSCGTRASNSRDITQEFGLSKLKALREILNYLLDPHYCPSARSRHSSIMQNVQVCVITRNRWFDYEMDRFCVVWRWQYFEKYTLYNIFKLVFNKVSKYGQFKVCKSVLHHTIQINQPTRCNNFSRLLLDVHVQLNMFRASSRPSSGAQQLQ
jgi:hypothetical protein